MFCNKQRFLSCVVSAAVLCFAAFAANASADDGDTAPMPTIEATTDGGEVAVPSPADQAATVTVAAAAEFSKNVVHGSVYTVPSGEDHYAAYGNVHGSLLRDGNVVAEFVTNETGEFTINGIAPGSWTVMLEQERDNVFGSTEVTLTFDLFHEETLVLFLNKCGAARFPSDFDASVVLAENSVKYWQYVNCGASGPSHAVPVVHETASNAYAAASNTCSQCGQASYAACQQSCDCCCGCSMGNGMGALGLLGLLGLIGLSEPGPVSEY